MKHEFMPNDRVSLKLDDDGVAQLRLTRGDKLNALDEAMFDALIDAGRALFDMPGLRCVVISGEGPAFSAGLDIATLKIVDRDEGVPLAERTHGNANRVQQAAMQWRKLPVPVIAAVHGVCFGGGLQLASGADLRVVAPDARLAVLEMKWGLIPDMGGFALWRGTVRDDFLRGLTYTNREFSGEEAVRIGFATMTADDPLDLATAAARDIASRSPTAIRAAKKLFNRYLELPVDEILLEESMSQQRLFGTKNQLEAVLSQLEGRKPNFVDP